MSSINNNLNVRPIANTPIEDRGTTFQSECTAEQQEAQEVFEKALNCVESNVARRGRNQRDWDAPCTKMDAVAVAHSAFWGGVIGGTGTAAATAVTAASLGTPPQGIAVSAAVMGVVGAATGFGQAITDPDNTTSVDPANYFSENPLQPENKKGLDSQ